MATLKIRKVATLPTTLEPDALYFLVNNNKLVVYVTNITGTIVYNTLTDGESASAALAMINSMAGQPNGLATLDSLGNVNETTIHVEGQNLNILSNGQLVWDCITLNSKDAIDKKLDDKEVTNNYKLDAFKKNRVRTATFVTTLPQDYSPSSDIVIRLNIIPAGIPSGGVSSGNVPFELRYVTSIGMGGGVLSNEIIDNKVIGLPSAATPGSGIATSVIFTPIVGTALRPNSVIMFKVSRLGHGSTDTYNADIGMISVDICYRKDKLGTRNLTPDFNV